ncbi:sensor histidine kinase [Hoeflea prorocentri]|uniref:C4-dicarboxylate transport sensor protein n=1 Tax=Hoeflea prorocentri TaxID=1922333 RepID=A0A9X3ZHV3_9HYPH|nr:ATP-binding protein [Hoeflea prorocentri]MCY6381226.1 ATP-binding protein [Hoeflea prorocentri]MDA5399026.1 ATP-binding protein [Hoeflea prorocentri]
MEELAGLVPPKEKSGRPRLATGRRGPRFTVVALLVIGVLGLLSVFWVSQKMALAAEERRSLDRMSLYLSTLTSALEEHQHLPFILSWDPLVIGAVEGDDTTELNLRLESFSDQAGIDAIYLMDPSGLTIAASNWNETQTFIGNNYSFRPYFKKALSGGRGVFFAIGATTQEPGFFISEPVYASTGHIAGVIALKVDLTPLTRAWREGGETLLAADSRGVVILASNPDWTYRTLLPLSNDARVEIADERQFGNEPLDPLNYTVSSDHTVSIGDTRYLQTVGEVGHLGWRLHYLASLEPVNAQARQSLVLAAAALSLFAVAFLLVRTNRVRSALFASQEQRRSLQAINRQLEDEIEERRAAERRLEHAQKELRQVSKLAALGQLSASVTHELGQPIAAMRNYLAAADLPGSAIEGEARELVDQLNAITARMEHITGQLRFFAHRQTEKLVLFDLRDAIGAATEMMRADLASANINLNIQQPDEPVCVFGDMFRIEQVLVNMIRNARDAVAGCDAPNMTIKLTSNVNQALLSVRDNGPGLTEEALTHAEDPFFTTKASGVGMGLGLSISAAILKDHDGRMTFDNGADGGAVFTMILPLADEEQKAGSTQSDAI